MGTMSSRMPRLSARRRASASDPSEEYREGIDTPVTFSAPSASAAMQATMDESMPPESPTSAAEHPDLRQ